MKTNNLSRSQPLQAAKFHKSIYSLTLDLFQTVLFDNDLTALVIDGEPTEAQLVDAWDNILYEYSEKLSGAAQAQYIKLESEVTRKRITQNSIVMLVGILRQSYVKQFANNLNRLAEKSFKWDITNLTEYDKQLDSCLLKAKTMGLMIDIKLTELKVLASKLQGEQSKPSREYFQRVLNNLSAYLKFQLDETKLKVFQYCDYIKQYNRYLESLKNK